VLVGETQFQRIQPDDDEPSFACVPQLDEEEVPFEVLPIPLELPASFLAQHMEQLLQGDRKITILGATLKDQEIEIERDAVIQLHRQPRLNFDIPRRFIFHESVTHPVLVVRVSTLDSTPNVTADLLRRTTFANDSVSLRSQFLKCSAGTVVFAPFSNELVPEILGGVLDIELDLIVSNISRRDLTHQAINYTNILLGVDNVEDVVDYLMLCLPPGTKEEWLAYAFKRYYLSVYNDVWCAYISATMHELGHSAFGFLHSNQYGIIQADTTGYMGYSYGAQNFPCMCFNAHKNWLGGWFRDRALQIKLSNPKDVWNGKIAAFVDYHLTTPEEPVVIRVGDLYLQYNRAKDFNNETMESSNQLVVVQDRPRGSELLASLDGLQFNTTFYMHRNFNENNDTLFIAVCAVLPGDNETFPDFMDITIGNSKIDCSRHWKGT
jgi:hypothetical protein